MQVNIDVPKTDIRLLALKGDKGDTGSRGYSPTATVTKNNHTATITITDINGTTTANITDGTNGTNGTDGFSPTATVSKSGSTVTISITDKNGTTTSTITEPASSYTYQKATTLSSSGWTSSSGTYYYQITDSSITASDQVNGFLDLTNQALLKDGYIETFSGYYRIYTSTQPTSNISITLTKVHCETWS